jgi:hypothetical protein
LARASFDRRSQTQPDSGHDYVSQLERGAKRPRGATLKPLSLIKSKGLEAVLQFPARDLANR